MEDNAQLGDSCVAWGGGRLGREFGGVLKHNLQLGGSWVASGGRRLGRELAVAY